MGILELLLFILLIAAIVSRPHLALGMILDFIIAILVISLLYRLIVVLF